jgi:hypothetical protein
MSKPKYDLVGIDGNAYAIMAYVSRAMKEQGFNPSQIGRYVASAKKKDYSHLISVSITYIDKCNERAKHTNI